MLWTEAEEKLLKTGYMLEKENLMGLLPGRTWGAIRGKITRLGLRRRKKRELLG